MRLKLNRDMHLHHNRRVPWEKILNHVFSPHDKEKSKTLDIWRTLMKKKRLVSIIIASIMILIIASLGFASFVFDESKIIKDKVVVDTVAPQITASATKSGNNVTITATITDPLPNGNGLSSGVNTSATRYMVTNSKTTPSASASGWQTSNVVSSTLTGTLYAWVKGVDNVGNTHIYGAKIGGQKLISDSTITVTFPSETYTYDGWEHTPLVTVRDTSTNTTLVYGTDYYLEYTDNIDAGTGHVTITGRLDYSGSRTADFTINKATLTIIPVDVEKNYGEPDPVFQYSYSGNVIRIMEGASEELAEVPVDNFADGGRLGRAQGETPNAQPTVTVDEDDNVIVTYSDPGYEINLGTLQLVDTPNATGFKPSNYQLQVEPGHYLRIKGRNISMSINPSSFIYDGTAKEPEITLSDENGVLELGTDYISTDINISDNINVGIANVHVSGIAGLPSEGLDGNFAIGPANPTITLGDVSKVYDGTPVNSGEITVTGVGDTPLSKQGVYITYYADANCTIVTNPSDHSSSGAGQAPASVGSYYARATYPAQGNYAQAVSNIANVTITAVPFYENVQTGVRYFDLDTAFEEAVSGQTIRVIVSRSDETENAILPLGKTGVKLDLNGNTIDMGSSTVIVRGSLEIFSSVAGGRIEGLATAVVANYGLLTIRDQEGIEGLTIINSSITDGSAAILDAAGTLNIGNSSDDVSTTSPIITSVYGHGIHINDGAVLNFYDGIVTGKTSSAIVGAVCRVPEDYYLKTEDSGATQIAFLDLLENSETYDEIELDTTAPTISNIINTPESPITVTCTIEDLPGANGATPSGVNETATRYMITASATAPSESDTNWQESNIINTSLLGDVYIWIMAKDNVDNVAIVSKQITIEGNWINTTTNTQYISLKDALLNAASNQTIKALKATTETENASLASGKTGVKVDLAGFTITMQDAGITNNGTLDIYSSVAGAVLQGGNTTGILLVNAGTLTVNGTSGSKTMTLSATSGLATARVLVNNSTKTATLNENVTLNMTAVTTGNRYVVENKGILNIKGATITNIVGGTKARNRGILISTSTAKLSITYGTIDTEGIAIYNSASTNTSAITISQDSGKTTTITTSAGDNTIHNNAEGTMTITGGTITNTKSNGRGVYVQKGTFILGTDDNRVSYIAPEITASSGVGVLVASGKTFNFYDGKITGKTNSAISGNVYQTPRWYGIKYTTPTSRVFDFSLSCGEKT